MTTLELLSQLELWQIGNLWTAAFLFSSLVSGFVFLFLTFARNRWLEVDSQTLRVFGAMTIFLLVLMCGSIVITLILRLLS